jgi:hypothetical protein
MVDDEMGLKLRGSRVLEGKAEFQAIATGLITSEILWLPEV